MTDPDRVLERVQHLLDLNRPEAALEAAMAHVADRPEDSDLWCTIALALLRLGRHADALAAAEKAAGLGTAADPSWPHRIRSRCLRALFRWREAVEAGRRAVELAPNEWLSHLTLAEACIKWPQTILHSPGSHPAAPALAQVNWGRSDAYGPAAAAAEHAVELAPNEPEALLVLARVRKLQKRKAEAKTLADRAAAMAPDDGGVLERRAHLLRVPGALSGPARGFAQAAALNPRGLAADAFARTVRRATLWGSLWLLGVWALLSEVMEPSQGEPRVSSEGVQLAVLIPCCWIAFFGPLVCLLWRLEAPTRRAAVRSLRTRWKLLLALAAMAMLPVGMTTADLESAETEPGDVLITVIMLVLFAVAAITVVQFFLRIFRGARGAGNVR